MAVNNKILPMTSAGRRQLIHDKLSQGLAKGAAGRGLVGFLAALILANFLAFILETHEPLYLEYREFFNAFELFSVTIFTLEYAVRVWCCTAMPRYQKTGALKARLHYVRTPMAVIDLLAVLPFYLSLFVQVDLRYLRLFRLVRVIKLSHYFSEMNLFLKVVRKEVGAIGAAVSILTILVMVAACLMYLIEHQAQPEVFASVIDSVWWAVVTLTTVGYGDVTPITYGGKLLGMVIMILGVGIAALPAALLAGRFSEELRLRREQLESDVQMVLKDGVVDDEERAALEAVRKELGLNEETLRWVLDQEAARVGLASSDLPAKPRNCPHCNQRLDG